MFDALSGKLQETLRRLRGRGVLTEENIAEAMREIRLALLDADVNYRVAKEFVARAQARCVGQAVLKSVTPGQQVVKIVHDELVEMMGEGGGLRLPGGRVTVMLVGLHGCGKTTTAAKLARLLREQGRRPMLVAADVYRPAAIEQLETLGREADVPVHSDRSTRDVSEIADRARSAAQEAGCDVLIVDTAGRLHIDEELVQELVRLRQQLRPQEILLVADAATGQEAVSIAQHFDEALRITGVVLTRLDGDARGGAALSMRAVTGKPVKLVGVGERLDALEPFHPERMVSRLLGMGDVVSLVERAQKAVDEDEARRMEERLRQQQFDLEDFLNQLRQVRKLGPIEQLVGMLPGMGGKQLGGLQVDERELKRVEAIILSMTLEERRHPGILVPSRRRRIARGSGTSLVEVNQLISRFQQMRKMLRKMGKMEKKMTRLARGGRRPF